MPLSFVLDENLCGPLWKLIQAHNRNALVAIDVVRVGDPDCPPRGSMDEAILAWAEESKRIIVSQDWRTMGIHLRNHLKRGRHSPGVLLIRSHWSLAKVVEVLVLSESIARLPGQFCEQKTTSLRSTW